MTDEQELSESSRSLRRALDAVGASFDAAEASHHAALNSTKDECSKLKERMTALERNYAGERQYNSERLLRLEEAFEELKDALPSKADRELLQAPRPAELRRLEEDDLRGEDEKTKV